MLALAGAVAVGGCMAAPAPVSVTRFHLPDPVERGSVSVEPVGGAGSASFEFGIYARAVAAELAANGFQTSDTPSPQSQYLATLTLNRTTRELPPSAPPVTIGLGGGSFGGGVGGGGSVAFGVGKRRVNEAVVSQISVQIRRRADATVVWEGRAQTEARSTSPDAQAEPTANRLARALFQGFPGESGRTITVK